MESLRVVQPFKSSITKNFTPHLFIIQLSLFISIFFDFPIIRPVLGIITISMIPGVVSLALTGMDFDRIECIPYIVVTSLAEVIALGAFGSVISRRTIAPQPFTDVGVFFWILLPIFSLTLILHISGRQPVMPPRPLLMGALSKHTVITLCGFFIIVLGTYVLNNNNQNHILILGILVLFIIPVLATFRTPSDKEYAVLSWLVGLAILFQNSLIDINLTAGDGRFEYGFAMSSLIRGAFDPTIPTIRSTSLRLAVLNPELVSTTGIQLETVMTVIHPLLMSVLCVGLYALFKKQFSPDIAFLSVVLIVFSVPWINGLSRNSRTGIAILFAVVCVLLLLDSTVDSTPRSVILVACFFGVPVSHYGIGPIFAVILSVAYASNLFSRYVSNQSDRFSLLSTNIVLYSLGITAWFMYTSDGAAFRFVVTSIVTSIETVVFSGVGSAQGVEGASTSMPSLTFAIIKYEYILVLLLAAVGLLISVCNRDWIPEPLPLPSILQEISKDFQPRYHSYTFFAAGAASIVPIAFIPGVGIGVSRIFIFSIMLLAPYTILFLKNSITRISVPILPTIAILFSILLIINTGVVAATITNDNSRQPYLDRPDRIENGNDELVYELFRVYRTDRGWASTDWLYKYGNYNWIGEGDYKVYGAGVQPPVRTNEMRSNSPLERRPVLIKRDSDMCDGYIRLTPVNYIMDEVILTYYPDFLDYGNKSMSVSSVPLEGRHHIYTSSQTNIYAPC